ncbi:MULTISPECIES: AarF/UbiB family protein [Rhodomicrobium]|uniref:ABC1 kinase family protein n=1 Tax=Rhodomicrobium TaxID=1068 RepID=UPI000B4A97C8|nr:MULTISPECIES: AarF/UbiB family protein [Rhodomicrobium]
MTDNIPPRDDEANRLSRRLQRYAQVGTNVGGVAAGMATRYVLGLALDREKNATALASALGGLKGPLMKVAQLLSTIPDALPPEYAEELAKLQMHAPPMGWVFVKRRMAAELGPDWESRFIEFSREAAASASLGQVHKARAPDGAELACKLQYPDMQSAVEADLNQLGFVLAIHKRMDPAIDTSEIAAEISARLREELDYELEGRHMSLYGQIFDKDALIRVPGIRPELSTKRLLTMDWLEGGRLLDYKTRGQEERNQITRAMFRAWWHPFSHFGVIHGDPHLGNYSIFEEDGRAAGINLLDYGCVRTFAPRFVGGVIDLYHGILRDDRALIVHAYETWGFRGLSNELIDVLNLWAKFIYGPLLDNRTRRIAEGVSPSQYGRREAFLVHKGLKEKGPVKVPREFVFMDRAAIGLGGVFLHLDAEMNFYELFNETIHDFNLDEVAARQAKAFGETGVPLPE